MEGKEKAEGTSGQPPPPERKRRAPTAIPDDYSLLSAAGGNERGPEVVPPQPSVFLEEDENGCMVPVSGNLIGAATFTNKNKQASGTAALTNMADQQRLSQPNELRFLESPALPHSAWFRQFSDDLAAGGTAAPTNLASQQPLLERNNDQAAQASGSLVSPTNMSLVPTQQFLTQQGVVRTGQRRRITGVQANPSQATRPIAGANPLSNPAIRAAAAATVLVPTVQLPMQSPGRLQSFQPHMMPQHGGYLPQRPEPPPGIIGPQQLQMSLHHGGGAGVPVRRGIMLSVFQRGWNELLQKRHECEKLAVENNALRRALQDKTRRVKELVALLARVDTASSTPPRRACPRCGYGKH